MVDARRLYETAICHGVGSGVAPDEIEREAERQGLLVKGGKATTQAVLALESRSSDLPGLGAAAGSRSAAGWKKPGYGCRKSSKRRSGMSGNRPTG